MAGAAGDRRDLREAGITMAAHLDPKLAAQMLHRQWLNAVTPEAVRDARHIAVGYMETRTLHPADVHEFYERVILELEAQGRLEDGGWARLDHARIEGIWARPDEAEPGARRDYRERILTVAAAGRTFRDQGADDAYRKTVRLARDVTRAWMATLPVDRGADADRTASQLLETAFQAAHMLGAPAFLREAGLRLSREFERQAERASESERPRLLTRAVGTLLETQGALAAGGVRDEAVDRAVARFGDDAFGPIRDVVARAEAEAALRPPDVATRPRPRYGRVVGARIGEPERDDYRDLPGR
jgi:hypothetical protein